MVLDKKFHQLFKPDLLPLEDPFNGRFDVLNKSEIEDNEWILLYLELAVATSFRNHTKHGLTSLKILKVAMEIPPSLVEPLNKGLDAYDAIFYISYKDFCKARVGKDVDSIAIVRTQKIIGSEIGNLKTRRSKNRLVTVKKYTNRNRCTQSSQTIKPSNTMEAGSSSSMDLD
ncbi:UPF0725 protein At4g11700 [Arabidopsis lyrata subsp. lyrata]|uniref:UPF0725 protein At4g11700 n=1 Tax=Arabidopsis lyrata subsp. lyrata TaxID=81972 RepID=UPI000A29E67C|nr:UPF0725 protein At4g11700 [Arabidopsis lyrata subsp. lyrata]|eukprot:XP_020877183.1 UPF0725 protein At4g11700 [Arabidopsis lyrata subsp. lyrata]